LYCVLDVDVEDEGENKDEQKSVASGVIEYNINMQHATLGLDANIWPTCKTA
jgi:hypothetical protein